MNPYAMCSLYSNSYNPYPCGCIRQNNNQFHNYFPPKNFSYEWSRMGPMGGLTEPKLIYVPQNPAADIQVETNIRTKISQTPTGFANMQFTMPPPDILRRINEERLRTTYQSDFCNTDNYPMIIDYSTWVYNNNKKARLANMKRQESEELQCSRPQPKPPYLGGHDIPGRKRKEDSGFSAPEKKSIGKKRSSQISSRLSRGSREQKNGRLESLQKAKVDKEMESGSRKKNNDEVEVEVAVSNLEDKETGYFKNSSEDLGEKLNKEEENNKEFDGKKDDFEESNNQKNENEDKRNSNSSYESADSCRSTKKNVDDDTYVYLNYSNRRRRYTVDLGNENLDLRILPWLSEYQDTIGGTGDEILKTKLHYYGKLRLLPDYIAHQKKQADMKKSKDKKKPAKN